MHSFLSILIFLPTVGAIIGWVCKWVAIRMLFAPSQYVGIGPIGWQGVVQRRAPKFAAGVADTVATAGISVDKLIEKVDGAAIADHFGPILDAEAEKLLETIVETVKPGGWTEFAGPAREQMAEQLGVEGRRVGAVLVDELRPHLIETIDVKKLVVKRLSGENADHLAALFQRIARHELRIVIYYGAVLGFFIGLVEVGFYAWLEKWWLLPIVGAIDGVVNNWLAIQMIFRPYEKKRYLGVFPFQGLFPARQHDISGEYGHMMANDVLSPKDVFQAVVESDGRKLGAKAVEIVEREMGMMIMMIPMLLGVEMTPEVKSRVIDKLVEHLPGLAMAHEDRVNDFLRERLAIEQTLTEKLRAMSKPEFESVLRGIFEEDEWILVSLGGLLGGLIGLLQGALVLALD
ncbi:MAG: hypothetical protein U0230_26070 [Polyangiales bacterium]